MEHDTEARMGLGYKFVRYRAGPRMYHCPFKGIEGTTLVHTKTKRGALLKDTF